MRGTAVSRRAIAFAVALLLGACSTDSKAGGGRIVRIDRPDFPLSRATPEGLVRFQDGAALFDVTLREADGLGPLYIRSSCGACHANDGRGPGFVRKMSVTDGA